MIGKNCEKPTTNPPPARRLTQKGTTARGDAFDGCTMIACLFPGPASGATPYRPAGIPGRRQRTTCRRKRSSCHWCGATAAPSRVSTRFTERYGVKHPIILAPMGGCAGGVLAASVSASGALGLVGSGGETVEHLLREWGRGVTLLHEKTGGVGGDSEQEDRSLSRPLGFGVNVAQIPADELANIVRELKPSHVYLSFGDDVVRNGLSLKG